MIIGKVVGSVVSTRKSEKLTGQKLMIVEPLELMGEQGRIVAIDPIGAGIGETVLVTQASAAWISPEAEATPIDAAIVGIVDEI